MTRLMKAGLLLFFFSLCGAAFIVTHRVRAPAPAPQTLFAVMNEQLAAFRAADYPGAYRYAATGVQQKFTLPQFEKMVRRNYAELTSAQRVEFGTVEVEGSNAFVQVFFFAGDGTVRLFLYNLIAEEDGWKIAGVEELSGYRKASRASGTRV